MKKILAILLSCALVMTGCGQKNEADSVQTSTSKTEEVTATETINVTAEETKDVKEPETESIVAEDNVQIKSEEFANSDVQFDALNDTKLLSYLEDSVYAELTDIFASDDYVIEDIKATYISKEYLEEFAYNSQSNIWFGYTMDELKEQFDGTPYVFTLAEDGTTEVVAFEGYDDTYDRVIKNVAIGTGVVLICVTVSVASGGTAPVGMVFAASAKTGTAMALSSGVISGVMAGTVTGIKTKDVEQAIKAAALQGSEGFKWGAITGALVGGAKKIITLRKAAAAASETATSAGNTLSCSERARQAELRALEKYGGKGQVSYLAGQEVPYSTPNATRPDITRTINGHLEGIEVKNYDLSNPDRVRSLSRELRRQIGERVTNMPSGSTQRIVLDVTDRGFTGNMVEAAKNAIWDELKDIYPNIPIDVIGTVVGV